MNTPYPDDKTLKGMGAMKINAFLRELFLRESFQQQVHLLRKKYRIPESGFRIVPANPESNDQEYRVTLPPEGWIGWEDAGLWGDFEEDLISIENEHGLLGDESPFLTPLAFYIFFNVEAPIQFCPWQLCFIENRRGKISQKETARMDKTHPVCIRVSSYASSSDIVAFINAAYSYLIKPLQQKSRKQGLVIGRVKTKNTTIKERDMLIYSHRDLPIREIRKLLSTKYGASHRLAADEGSIGKILSLQRKKRKDL